MKGRNHHDAAFRRGQIMQAATRLFARQGFEGTSTREIAALAGVNEAIIFRHFPCKEDLYWAILEDKIHPKNGGAELEDRLAAGENDRRIFRSIAEDILRSNTEDPSLSRLLLFSALENHRLSHRFFRTYVADYYEVLAQHIRKRIRSGEFRDVDPLLAARGFLGMISYHFLIQELFGGKRYRRFAAQRVTETLTEIWLEGMRTRNRKRSRHLERGERN